MIHPQAVHPESRVRFAAPPDKIRRAAMGFTLLEVLIVLAILTMLIAILIPGLRKARAQVKRTVCQTNLKQIGNGWHMYLDANDGHFLKGINANWNYGGKQGTGGPAFGLDPNDPEHSVPKPLNPYLGLNEVIKEAGEVFRCPADEGGGDVPTTHFDYKGTSYTANLTLVGQTQLNVRLYDPCFRVVHELNKYLATLSRPQIRTPSKLILMGDGGWLSSWDFANPHRIEWHEYPCSHNIGFMDGHVEFVRIRKGLHVTPRYVVIPYASLQAKARECQEEVECE